VNPDRKWYIAPSGDSLETGGRTPNASAVRNTMVRAWPARPSGTKPEMNSSGYATRVFSVREPSS
jgi:hypothetical protein